MQSTVIGRNQRVLRIVYAVGALAALRLAHAYSAAKNALADALAPLISF